MPTKPRAIGRRESCREGRGRGDPVPPVEECDPRETRERILVNNVAYQHDVPSIEELTDDHWDRRFRTNLHGFLRVERRLELHHGRSPDVARWRKPPLASRMSATLECRI